MSIPADPSAAAAIELSIIAPAHNEQDNIDALIAAVAAAIEPTGIAFELIVIDDGSTDATRARLRRHLGDRPWLRVLAMTHTPPASGAGQSAAFCAGIRESRGELIAMIDADLQNDPADLPAMIALLRDQGADMVQGDRSANRRDTPLRRLASRVGRALRRAVLGDTIRDTGCSLRVLKRELGLQLPLQYKGVHRFIPFYARMLGRRVIECPVRHRPRTAGKAKYTALSRALPALSDLFAVRWMRSRARSVAAEPLATDDPPAPGPRLPDRGGAGASDRLRP